MLWAIKYIVSCRTVSYRTISYRTVTYRNVTDKSANILQLPLHSFFLYSDAFIIVYYCYKNSGQSYPALCWNIDLFGCSGIAIIFNVSAISICAPIPGGRNTQYHKYLLVFYFKITF